MNFIIFKQMIIEQQRILDQLQPLIKIIMERQSMFFQVLGFANKNIESSSNEIDQITLFTKFIALSADRDVATAERQSQFMKILGPNQQQYMEGFKISNSSKQMMRLSGRVIEILQSSIERTRNSLFNQNGKLSIQFARFKKNLHKTIQQNPIELLEFAKVILGFCRNKYKRQITRIKNYLQKLKDGEHISLRDMYAKDGSDASVSPDQKHYKQKNLIIKANLSKLQKQVDHSQSQSPTKRSGLKRPEASKAKRSLNMKSSKKQSNSKNKQKEKPQKQTKAQKSATAAHLLKFYSIMQVHKKQFLQDYVFQKQQQQKHRKRLLSDLLERNKLNIQQINGYSQKCLNYNPAIHYIANPSSDENRSVQRNDSSLNSKASIKTSFVISKRKQSFTFQSGSDKSDVQLVKNQIPFSRTIKNLSTKKRASEQKSKPTNRSKKIFVVKSPLTFDDDIIPKAQITQNGWAQAPLTGKERGRKNESIRLKKRNNPCPLDEKLLPQSFKFSHHPF